MNAVELLRERRSVRSFKDEVVSRELMKEIIELSRFAPSWGNFQVARYTLVDNPEVISKLTSDGVNKAIYNMNTLKDAKGVCVLSYVKGKSGKLDKDEYVTSKSEQWEVFDAGIACHQFTLAAYAKGVSSVVMGVIDDESISSIVSLPEGETVAALIVYGYETEHPSPTPRMEVEDILRFI